MPSIDGELKITTWAPMFPQETSDSCRLSLEDNGQSLHPETSLRRRFRMSTWHNRSMVFFSMSNRTFKLYRVVFHARSRSSLRSVVYEVVILAVERHTWRVLSLSGQQLFFHAENTGLVANPVVYC